MAEPNRYLALIESVFKRLHTPGATEFTFSRTELAEAAMNLGIKLPSNVGDVIYSVRYRTAMPECILRTQPDGQEWIIEGAGRGYYAFKLVKLNRIVPNGALVTIKIPDSTPELVAAHALTDEQALLSKVRYNRLVDVFLGLAAYSLQNHLRTTVDRIGQIEIDEIYLGIDRHGRQYVLPVQAKGGADKLGVVQVKQDLACCTQKFPHLICRPLAAQFMADDLIALFELTLEGDEVKIVDERHYRLVAADVITPEDLATYAQR